MKSVSSKPYGISLLTEMILKTLKNGWDAAILSQTQN